MRKLRWLRLGFYGSLTLLLISLAVLLWPYLSNFYFLQMAGLTLGIIGSTFFGMAMVANSPEKEEEA